MQEPRTPACEPCSARADSCSLLAHQPAAHPCAQDLGGGAVHLRPLLVHLRSVLRVVAQGDGVLVLGRRERVVMRYGDMHRTVVKGGALPPDAGVGQEAAEGVRGNSGQRISPCLYSRTACRFSPSKDDDASRRARSMACP